MPLSVHIKFYCGYIGIELFRKDEMVSRFAVCFVFLFCFVLNVNCEKEDTINLKL